MRHVNIQEVGMENYGPYLDPMVLQFKNDSLVLVTGPNGIGKTMSLDAIPYTFYGVTSKGAKGDDVVNNTAGKNCKTWVKFSIDSDEYLITRYRKYTKLNNTVILNKNGVDIKKGHNEVVPEIEKLICSRRSFVNTLMFGQKVKDFFTDLVDSDKKLIFRELLALELYQLYYKMADERLKEVNAKLNEIEKQKGVNEGLQIDAQNQIELLKANKKRFEDEKQTAINDLKKSIETNNRLLTEWQKELEGLKKENVDADATLGELMEVENQLNDIDASLNPRLDAIEKGKTTKLLDLQNQASEAKSKIKDDYRGQIDQKVSEQAELKESLNDLVSTAQGRKHKGELAVQEVESNINHLRSQIDEIKRDVLDVDLAECPLCKQEVSEETKQLLSDKVASHEAEVQSLRERVTRYTDKIKEINTEMLRGSEELNSFIAKARDEAQQLKDEERIALQEIDERLSVATQKVNSLVDEQIKQIHIENENSKMDLNAQKLELQTKHSEQEKAQEKIQSVETTIENLNNEINRIEFQIREKEKDEYDQTQLNSYKKRVLDLAKELTQLSKNADKLSIKVQILEFWKTGFSSSGIPSMLIDEAIPFMNEKVAYYLDKFTNGRYIVSFDTLAATKSGEFRDKISVNVIDTFTRANSRVQLSGGQTRIIDIATILTLGDLQENIQGVSINILLFDEIFDSLDEENIGYVSKVLSKLKFGKSIYLISHRHEDQLEADETLTLH